MPYMTVYHLGWNQGSGPTLDEVISELVQNSQKNPNDPLLIHPESYWKRVLEGDVETTWHQHQTDVANVVSLKWPDVRFDLSGQGDEPEDNWTEHFLGGRVHRVMAQATYPPFDPEQLTEPAPPAE